MKKKSQIAMEYIIILGFAFIASIFMFIVFFEESSDITNKLTSKQVENVITKIANNIDKVYYLGENSKTTLKINLPKTVVNSSVGNKEIVFKTKEMRGAISDNVRLIVADVSGELPKTGGIYFVTIQSEGDRVLINYT